MNPPDIKSAFQSLSLPSNHTSIGLSNLLSTSSQYRALFQHRRLPEEGYTDHQIESLLLLLSSLDTNNTPPNRRCGVGEREGRVYSNLVERRNYGFAHGIGRSGDITEAQPKAVGSSALAKLTLCLVLDAIRRGSGIDKRGAAREGILLPLCTGMSIALTLRSLKASAESGRDVVLWSRIDQKSCFKAILSAGLECVVIPTIKIGDCVCTDIDALQSSIRDIGSDRVLAIITTTSCFAPRVPDKIDEVAKICETENIAHVINNAYGLQCERTCKLLNRACVVGRVDAVICSTDKNFMVPVGGAIVLSPTKSIITNIGKIYAGRASAAPIIDLFITLLSMGLNGYKDLLEQRNTLRDDYFIPKFREMALSYNERVLECTDSNTISFGMTLNTLASTNNDSNHKNDEISYLGSMLFTRCVSGTRVIPTNVTKTICQQKFIGFGSSIDDYGDSYMTAAVAIGVTKKELEEFFSRLDKTWNEFQKKKSKSEKN
eukprot:CAMPEP_0195508254 /NCGR_PEP_ID=MMETSP0794_2-20130614/1511_1 /TAXON_ID=515487 /ORGANISM="Stephanopyxis turris, Strain CCMP 815" /LENGTH=488 /DNA_ID=CAMNT_0040635165 /DNA_START=18 /DNA_END=1484 /DNA_ORIENTATION=+